jgi:hypothetical protein
VSTHRPGNGSQDARPGYPVSLTASLGQVIIGKPAISYLIPISF